jgi:uridylate kinase
VKHKDAKRYKKVSFAEAISKRLGVMDAEAFSLCEANHIPILVFSMNQKESVRSAVKGENIGTLVS